MSPSDRPLPLFLRFLAVVSLLGGIARAAGSIAMWLAGREMRVSRLALGMYAAYSAWQLLQRRRVGLENMLWVCYFAGVLLAIGLGAWLYGGESFSPFYWLAPAWVVFLIWYLRRCRWTVDWVDAGDRHDETRDDDELDARG